MDRSAVIRLEIMYV